MAKLTLPDVGNILGNPTSAQSRINSNNTLIEQALENTLSLDGTTPNQMGADLDMNGHDLLNVGVINADSIAIVGSEDFITLIEQAEEAAEDALLYSQQAAEAAAAAAVFNPSSYLSKSGNLAGLADKAVARANLALATVAASGAYSDLAGKPTLGSAASRDVGTAAGQLVELLTGGKLPAVDGSNLTGLVKRGAAVATVGGTFKDITIPVGAKRVTVMCYGVSTSGASPVTVRLGVSGGIVAAGYNTGLIVAAGGSASFLASTVGVSLSTGGDAAGSVRNATITFNNINGNEWVAHGVVADTGTSRASSIASSLALTDVLTTVRITTENGTDTFDAGQFNVLWE